jgi:hypothetical protein
MGVALAVMASDGAVTCVSGVALACDAAGVDVTAGCAGGAVHAANANADNRST